MTQSSKLLEILNISTIVGNSYLRFLFHVAPGLYFISCTQDLFHVHRFSCSYLGFILFHVLRLYFNSCSYLGFILFHVALVVGNFTCNTCILLY